MWSREEFAALVVPPLVGMIHLRPLPGSPRWGGDLVAVEQAAIADADALVAGGAGAALVENFHDVPFFPRAVPPDTVAAMAVIVAAIRRRHPRLPLGVNVLRNDAASALAVAAVTGAMFIRVNVHVGAALTDQGVIRGCAHQTLRARRSLAADIGILADLRVKHAAPLGPRPLSEEAHDLRHRGLADAVIITGPATGGAADPCDLAAVRDALPDAPLLVGSGLTEANAGAYAAWADGAIVGTGLKQAGETPFAPVDQERVAACAAAVARWHLAKGAMR